MSRLTKQQYRLVTVASVLGITQGITWFILSLICIIKYLASQNSDPIILENPTYMDLVNAQIYMYLLYGNYPKAGVFSVNGIINPDTFQIFMWIYLMADVLWVALSIILIRSINRIGGSPVNIMKSWGVLTVFIAFIDFLLVVLLGAEYGDYCIPLLGDSYCTPVLIPVLVVAARGFILWIVNVVFAYFIYKIIKTILAGKNLRKLLDAGAQIPRATLQRSSTLPKQSQNNDQEGNLWDNYPRQVPNDPRIPPPPPSNYPGPIFDNRVLPPPGNYSGQIYDGRIPPPPPPSNNYYPTQNRSFSGY